MKIATSDSWSSCHRLGSLLQRIEAGKSPLTLDRPARSGEYGVLKVSAVSWGEFRPKENKAIPADFDVTGVPTVSAGDLIISRANTTELVGAAVVANEDHPQLLLSDKTLKLIPNKDIIWPKYLLYALRTPRVRRHIEAHATGTSDSMRNISQSNLCAAEIPLPALSEQMRIAAILDKADAIRRLRRESVRVAEELLRSTFLEIFGDPVTNPKRWPTCPLSDIADIASGVTKGRKLAGQELISAPYLRVANVQDGFLALKEVKNIDILPHELEKYRLVRGDVLLTEGGDPDKLGRGCVWQNEVQDCIHQNHIFRVRVRQDIVTPEFLSALVGSEYGKRYFLRSAKQTTGIASINMTQLRAFPVLLAEHKLQAQFSKLTQRYKSLRDLLAAAATTQQEAFDSLLHRAFRGELTSSESAPSQLSIFAAESKHS